jgi:hypothetical protein
MTCKGKGCGLPKHVGVPCSIARLRAGVAEPVSGASQLMRAQPGKVTPVVTPVPVTKTVTKPVVTAMVTPCAECERLRARIAELEGQPKGAKPRRDRADYMRAYRKRTKP